MEDRHRNDPAGPEDTHEPWLDRLHDRAREQHAVRVLDETVVEAIDEVLSPGARGVWGRPGAGPPGEADRGDHAEGGAGDGNRDGAHHTGDPTAPAAPTDPTAPAALEPGPPPGGTAVHGGALHALAATLRAYIPTGNTLDDDTFRRRHRLLCWVLALHLPALFAFALYLGNAPDHAALELVVPAACLLVAYVVRNRRLAAFHVTAGLVFCSSALVHLSEGMIEAHFHFFVLIGLIALYQDWVPFLWNVVFTVVSHGAGGAIDPESIYNHPAALADPWTWAVIHGVAVLAACAGVTIFWKNTELEQRRSTVLAEHLAAARIDAAQQQSVSELFVNLARRNQALLDRQLALITELEDRERRPEALDDLFQLDHLATRIRRNAESLLVLSGDEQIRRWSRPVPLTEVARAAAAEIEDYRRVDVLVTEHLELAGHAVADVAHLLAELIENATCFSPPRSPVVVRSHAAPTPGARCLLTIEDSGFGMNDHDLARANTLLVDPPDLDLRDRTLGFQVVGRLARRYGLQVRLSPTPGGGITAVVTLPEALVSERTAPPSTPARPLHARRSRAATATTSTERERRRAMLSRFQASQRAGKAIAGAPAGSLAPAGSGGPGLGRHVTEEGA